MSGFDLFDEDPPVAPVAIKPDSPIFSDEKPTTSSCFQKTVDEKSGSTISTCAKTGKTTTSTLDTTDNPNSASAKNYAPPSRATSHKEAIGVNNRNKTPLPSIDENTETIEFTSQRQRAVVGFAEAVNVCLNSFLEPALKDMPACGTEKRRNTSFRSMKKLSVDSDSDALNSKFAITEFFSACKIFLETVAKKTKRAEADPRSEWLLNGVYLNKRFREILVVKYGLMVPLTRKQNDNDDELCVECDAEDFNVKEIDLQALTTFSEVLTEEMFVNLKDWLPFEREVYVLANLACAAIEMVLDFLDIRASSARVVFQPLDKALILGGLEIEGLPESIVGVAEEYYKAKRDEKNAKNKDNSKRSSTSTVISTSISTSTKEKRDLPKLFKSKTEPGLPPKQLFDPVSKQFVVHTGKSATEMFKDKSIDLCTPFIVRDWACAANKFSSTLTASSSTRTKDDKSKDSILWPAFSKWGDFENFWGGKSDCDFSHRTVPAL